MKQKAWSVDGRTVRGDDEKGHEFVVLAESQEEAHWRALCELVVQMPPRRSDEVYKAVTVEIHNLEEMGEVVGVG